MKTEIEELVRMSKEAWVLIKEQMHVLEDEDEDAEEINYNLREAIRAVENKLAEDEE